MGVTDLEGRSYHGELLVESGHVRAFVDVTGDDASRWTDVAPPSYAAAALFTVAPSFLWDPEAGAHSRILIHADQRFSWHQPWAIGEAVTIDAQVERIRMRGGVAWVTFTAAAVRKDGSPVLDSTSLFLMSAEEPASESDPQAEPEPLAKARDERASAASLPVDPGDLTPLYKSASRSDLVRYAAATGDFNPLHWDHDVARAAGLPRIVCHGLLSASWALQQAARHVPGTRPVSEARFRFKQPLLAAEQAVVRGAVEVREAQAARLSVAVEANDLAVVEATVEVTA